VAAKLLTLYVSKNRSFPSALLYKLLIKISHTSDLWSYTVYCTLDFSGMISWKKDEICRECRTL